MHFGNSAGNFGGSAVLRPVGHDSAAAMPKLVALLPNYMQIVQNWSKKGVCTYLNHRSQFTHRHSPLGRPGTTGVRARTTAGISPEDVHGDCGLGLLTFGVLS